MNALRKKRYSHGFTLTELMIVVIVIGILVTIAIPNYARSTERAKCSQAIQVLKSMRTAALSFFSDNQTFAGATVLVLETQIGASFFSGDAAANGPLNENKDWHYSITAADATSITLQARRRGGPHVNLNITLSDDVASDTHEQWSNPGTDYPWDQPGSW